MLYPKNASDRLDDALFKQPGAEYRGAPFWAWNRELREEQLLKQVAVFREMGMGGFHIHARNGLATPYLGGEFMRLVKAVHDEAAGQGLLTWLYDEDRYPSGTAGGLVTNGRPDLALKYLLFTPYAYFSVPKERRHTRGRETCKENGRLLGSWAVRLDDTGRLQSYRRLAEAQAAQAGELQYYAYLESVAPQSWFNNQPSGDVMNPEAVDRFIAFTHARYKQALGPHFGKTVPAIFTDEPHFVAKGNQAFAQGLEDVTTTWTDDFQDTFQARYGYDLLDRLPEVFWEKADGALSQARWHYNDHCAQRFTQAFCGRVGAWCAQNGLMLTGHLMSERYLLGQTYAMSEAMRNYPAFQLPGIDVLADNREFTTAKQAQSIVRQHGRPGMLSELYGVTDWSFDFRGHKVQGDWQAALGVTVRVHHLAWLSMEGEAKRDYPAAIGYQSPWYREYKWVEDYFARLNTALTRGRAVCRLGVIHPIESFWLRFGPQEHTGDERRQREDNFQQLAEWLLYAQLDFDYICESLLPGQCAQGGAPLEVGLSAYDAILVPDCLSLRESTVERLEAFAAAGGHLVFAGRVPAHVDALPSDRVSRLAGKAQVVQHNRTDIVAALEDSRAVDVISLNTGLRPEALVSQLRQDGAARWFFLCHAEHPQNPDIPRADRLEIRLEGQWKATLYDALAGDIREMPCHHRQGRTIVRTEFWSHDSLLLYLEPTADAIAEQEAARTQPAGTRALSVEQASAAGDRADNGGFTALTLPLEHPVTLSEPNVLVLDWAAFSVDGGSYEPENEVLRVDALLRERFSWEQRDGRLCQPWALPDGPRHEHEITFRFVIDSQIALVGTRLALERAHDCAVRLNGQPVPIRVDGWYVDTDIHTIALPPLLQGLNALEVTVPIGRRVGAEACYLLGDFSVRLCGAKARLGPPVRSLCFGDIVGQGLPFYGGNVTYHLTVETAGDFRVQATHFRNPALSVDLDGERQGLIAFSPYRLDIQAAPGRHCLDITAYGNRYNTFGSIHNADERFYFPGNPGAWRTRGSAWSREYRLKPTGILTSPLVEARKP